MRLAVEHYEIAGYGTARNLARRLRRRRDQIALLIGKDLAEEENADQLLNQVARSLMSSRQDARQRLSRRLPTNPRQNGLI